MPSTGGKPSDSGVSRSTIARQAAPNNTIPAGTKKHSRQSIGARYPHKMNDESRAERMRRIPDRHLRGKLARREPMRHQPRAGRKTHPLKPAVERPQNSERQDRRAQPEQNVDRRRKTPDRSTMNQRALTRSPTMPLTNFDTPYSRPCIVRNRPSWLFVMSNVLVHHGHRHAQCSCARSRTARSRRAPRQESATANRRSRAVAI